MDLRARPEPLPRRAGWAAFGVFAALVLVGVADAVCPCNAVRVIVGAVLALAAAAVLAARPASVDAAQPAVAVVAGVGVALVATDASSNIAWFALCLLIGWAVWTMSYLVAAGLWLLVSATFVLEALVVVPDSGWFSWLGGAAFSLFGFGAGRHQRELVLQLREAQADLAVRAQAEERARIARELHDVIAHSLTVSLLHVSSARVALVDDPADADRALAEAERLGRASLDEVRHAVGTLRARGASDPTAPLPGSTDLPDLVAGFRRAGADVSATVEGDLESLPATVGLAAYRIVQEALTNAAKHAPGRPVTLRVDATDRSVGLLVDSEGRPGDGTGLGLVGMRERAESVGGTCEAGPGGPGWRVRASLPVRAS
ncbi:sensor histidine kinase [Jatrophihabitans fulvus]